MAANREGPAGRPPGESWRRARARCLSLPVATLLPMASTTTRPALTPAQLKTWRDDLGASQEAVAEVLGVLRWAVVAWVQSDTRSPPCCSSAARRRPSNVAFGSWRGLAIRIRSANGAGRPGSDEPPGHERSAAEVAGRFLVSRRGPATTPASPLAGWRWRGRITGARVAVSRWPGNSWSREGATEIRDEGGVPWRSRRL